MGARLFLIVCAQVGFFVVRCALVARLFLLGGPVALGVALLGCIALGTTVAAWLRGVPDLSWRGCFVGVSYLAVCVMEPGPMAFPLSVAFWVLVVVQLAAKLALGLRCTVTGPVFVDLCAGFPYNVVRHPMTAAEWSIAAVLLLSAPSAWNVFAFALVSFLNVVAIRYEESFLRTFPAYARYETETPWRIIPRVW